MTKENLGMDLLFMGKYHLMNWLCSLKFTWLLEATTAQVEWKEVGIVHWLLDRTFKSS